MKHALVFGASGALGNEITARLELDFHVFRASRSGAAKANALSLDDESWSDFLKSGPQLSAVVWAQGMNSADTVASAEPDSLTKMFEANVGFIHGTMRDLVRNYRVLSGGRCVIVSSIWQDIGRNAKFSYMVSKSAIGGLVRSAAIDLAEFGIAVNAVLPGVVDTPMTRANLSAESIRTIEGESIGGQLALPSEVAATTAWLCSDESSGLNAQFLKVDKGWSVKRSV